MHITRKLLEDLLTHWDDFEDVPTMKDALVYGLWKPICDHGHPAVVVELPTSESTSALFCYCLFCRTFTLLTNVPD